jgi:hypothetical protein
MPPRPTRGGPAFELRFHEQDELGVGGGAGDERGRDDAQGDEGQVGDDEVDGRAELLGVEGPHVGAFEHHDTRGPDGSATRAVPRPTSTAYTTAASRWSTQSVNPPVDAPASSTRRPATATPKASSAPASLVPPGRRMAARRRGR